MNEVETRPLHIVSTRCAWCDIQLTAIPDPPVEIANRLYHPSCVNAVLPIGYRQTR